MSTTRKYQVIAGVLGFAITAAALAQNLGSNDRAAILLSTAKSAFNDQNYATATEKFREYLRLGVGTKMEIASARFGLGVSLIVGSPKDYRAAAEALSYPAQTQQFKDRALASYYLAVAYRGMGSENNERADQQFRSAAQQFANAAQLFADGNQLDWAAKSRCDQADVLIRIGRHKEAAAATAALLDDAKYNDNRYRNHLAYYNGYANFAQKDYAAAVRSLAALAPFEQADIGVHALFLLARTHHLAGERPEAMANYQALANIWEKSKKPGQDAPDYVARAYFYWGVALAEFGSADEAMARFQAAVTANSKSPIAVEARLRAGMAGVQIRKNREAIVALEAIVDHPQHGDQALRWLAKAQYGLGATPVPRGNGVAAIMNAVPDPVAMADGIKQAIATYEKAQQRAKSMTDAGAKARLSIILLESGDMQQLARAYDTAALSYGEAASAAGNTIEIAEQATLRQAIALQLAGKYDDSDKVCSAFSGSYPRSASRPEALVRYAENALLAAYASKSPYTEAIARFNRVIEKYPDTTQASVARFGLATIHYVQNKFTEAAALLEKIPDSDRVDDLAGVSFMAADCQLRALPADAPDALTMARLVAKIETIIVQLESFVSSRPNDPEAADAHIRIGYASQKLATMLADPTEQRRLLAKARRSYATIVNQYADHPLYPVAVLENAKIIAAYSGGQAAINELLKFQTDPLAKTAIAPLAMIHLADSLRLRRKPIDAVQMLDDLRTKHEAELLKDPQRAAWVPVMRYSLALSLKEAGKYAEAKEAFAALAKEFPNRSEAAEAPWRIAQCDMDQAMIAVDGQRRALAAAVKPQTQQDVLANLIEAAKPLRAAAEKLGKDAAALANKDDESAIPQKMNYDAAWCWRVLGEVEVEGTRRAMQQEALKKLADKLARDDPDTPVSNVRPPEIALTAIPLQPGEKQSRVKYREVMDAAGDAPLADEARIELAELYTARDEADEAIALYKEAIDRDSNSDLADRLRTRLGQMHLAKVDAKAAFDIANAMITSQRPMYAAYALALAVEAKYQMKDWAGVIEHASVLMETRRAERLFGITDHALLRMAHAQQQLGQWDKSKATLEDFISKFDRGSTYAAEAKYALGLAHQQLKEYEKAILLHQEVAGRSAGELGGKAWYQIGLCRLANNEPEKAISPLLTVGYGYDYAELNPAALVEAARAMAATGKAEQAKKVLSRVMKDYPKSEWAGIAKTRLGELK